MTLVSVKHHMITGLHIFNVVVQFAQRMPNSLTRIPWIQQLSLKQMWDIPAETMLEWIQCILMLWFGEINLLRTKLKFTITRTQFWEVLTLLSHLQISKLKFWWLLISRTMICLDFWELLIPNADLLLMVRHILKKDNLLHIHSRKIVIQTLSILSIARLQDGKMQMIKQNKLN